GRWSWQDQAGQGHEVDGMGRWPGHSIGNATGERFAAEVTLAESALAQVKVPCWGRGRPPQQTSECHRGRAYDSNPLRERLHRRGIELLVPQRSNRDRRWRQDGRKLR